MLTKLHIETMKSKRNTFEIKDYSGIKSKVLNFNVAKQFSNLRVENHLKVGKFFFKSVFLLKLFILEVLYFTFEENLTIKVFFSLLIV